MTGSATDPTTIQGPHGLVTVFKSNSSDTRYGVRLVPLRHHPHILVFDMAEWNTAVSDKAAGVSPLLDRVLAYLKRSQPESFDDPAYRKLCHDLGLNPDQDRPEAASAAA